MEKLLFVFVAIAAIIMIAASRPVQRKLCRVSPTFRERLLKRRGRAPELLAARVYWYNAVMRDWEPSRPITESQLFTFSSTLSDLLVLEALNTGDYPDIGVYFYAPHTYGVHPILKKAAESAGIPSGDLLQASLPAVQMRISSEEIAIKRVSEENWTLFWRSGDCYSLLFNPGLRHRPRRAVA